ncbi:hypothetical protein CERSUDRAFT_119495 [Gelatoporia subvermispora B]|uniref:Uncharacterized protein n=1 Tax=Ceriporiopsis subvermispora (strain B) TaxID=914234 RepID=M2QYR1_CERS8|nr:hypothetical protein CERSUDRAFT_119495 [Gelatoporia subvermispora B]
MAEPVLRSNNAKRPDAAAICKRLPRITHLRIAQVLGYSHPRLEGVYYVINTGGVALLQYVQYLSSITDTKAVLQVWLQSLLDHENACGYVEALSPESMLGSYSCSPVTRLATTRVDESNRFLFSVEDMTLGKGGLLQFWRLHFPSLLQSYHQDLCPILYETCLSALRNPSHNPHINHLRRSQGMTDAPRESLASVRLGDYGYFTTDAHVIYLGNIIDIISTLYGGSMDESRIWKDIISTSTKSPTQIAENRFSSLWYTPDIGSQRGRSRCGKSVHLSKKSLQLFWSRAVHIAAQHDIALHNMHADVNWYRRKCVGCSERKWCCQNCHWQEVPFTRSSSGEHVDDPSLGGKFGFGVEDHVQNSSDDCTFSTRTVFPSGAFKGQSV